MAEPADETSNALPDPYGHGFARAENPVQRTTEKWERQEGLRLRFGLLARNPLMLLIRLLFGASVAAVALMSVISPSLAPAHPGYVLLFWTCLLYTSPSPRDA